MRKVTPKAGPAPSAGQTRKQRERFVQAGGMLQGYSPDFVVRLGYIGIGIAVACVLIIAAILIFVPRFYGLVDAPPARLKQVPGNQVNVVLTVTPNLRHVRSVGVMGQRMVGRVEPPVPPVMKRLQQLPVITPIALAIAAILGDDAVALSPIPNSTLHATLAIVAGTALAAAVYGVSYLLQRRMMKEVQALVPK